MDQALLVLMAAVPVYIVVAIGPLLRKVGALTPEMDKGVMTMAVYLFFPSLILDKMLHSEVLRDASVVFSAMGVGFGTILVGTALAWFIGPMLGLRRGKGRRTFAVTAGLQNYGFLVIPLIASLYPTANTMGVLFIHNLGVEFAMWTVGVMLLSGQSIKSVKSLMKGPIVAVVLGIFLLQTGLDAYVPQVLLSAFHMLGGCAVPISLLLIGTVLYDLLGEARFNWKISVGGVFVRLVLLSVMLLAAAKWLPISLELKQVLVVQAGMPSAMFPIVLSRHYGGETNVAIIMVLSTTVVSLVSMPLIISFGKFWVGV